MKAFVTGGTGFIGRHLVRKLLARKYEVYALTRSESGAAELSALGARPVRGDIHNPASMAAAMAGSDVVFHLAGWYEIGDRDWLKAESINVAGTRHVLSLATELNVPKIIYTSTVTVFGDTGGRLVDETFYQGGPFLTEYDRTKWLAHYKVAVPLIEQGAPIIILMPGVVYGPGDHSLIGDLMRLFYQGKLPAVPAPEFTVTYAHVEDIAEAHILAVEKGRVGETYITTGPAIPLGEMVDFWSQLTGQPAPALRVPARFLTPTAPLLGSIGEIVPLPSILSRDAAAMLGATYMASAEKARRELGWRTRSLQDGMSETFRWIAAASPAKTAIPDKQRKLAGLALLAAAGVLILWLNNRRR